MRFTSVLVASSFALAAIAGCAADPASERDDVAAQDAATRTAQASCSAAEYRKGLATYKETVALAKRHLDGEMCDDATTFDVLKHASESVAQCAAFEKVYETSVWAKPVRDVLAKNLGLAEVTGKLRATEAGRPTWTGLAEALPGKTIYGPAPGAFGNVTKLELASRGRATLSSLDTETLTWTSKPVTYTIGAMRPDGTVTFTVTDGATQTDYALGRADYGNGTALPIYELRPLAGGAPSFSIPSECEA